jgi:uncharacterized membrane protein YfcA
VSLLHALVVILAGMWAGTINAIVGSGSLVTFPVLLLLGYPPVTANVSNNLGLVAGGVTASFGYRRELAGTSRVLLRMMPMSILGSAIGAILLLVLPASAFSAIVPVLIVFGLLMVAFGPRIQAWSREHHHEAGMAPRWQFPALLGGILVAGIYGGYFGAAQGVILMGLLSTLATGDLQRLNGIKNVLGTCVNIVAALVFLVVARDHIDWWVVLFITIGAIIGGFLGASIGRRLPPPVLRAVILAVGVVGIVKLVWFS